jgi:hypothetical protein
MCGKASQSCAVIDPCAWLRGRGTARYCRGLRAHEQKGARHVLVRADPYSPFATESNCGRGRRLTAACRRLHQRAGGRRAHLCFREVQFGRCCGPDVHLPVGLCTEGTISSGLKGSFSFTATSLIQTVDTPSTSVLLYTGDLTLRTKDGDFTCKDAGAFRTVAEGAVSSVCTIVAGTGAYAGVTGTLQFVGNFSSTTGGVGEYSGSLATP